MKQSTFGLRSSVFGLLIFLFSASQVECAKQAKPVQKPVPEKQVVTTNGRLLGEFCFGASIGAGVAALVGWIIVSNRDSVIDKLARKNGRMVNSSSELSAKNAELRQETDENKNLTFQYMVIASGQLEGSPEEKGSLGIDADTGEILKSNNIPLKVGDVIIVTQPKSRNELKLKVDKIIAGTALGTTYEFEYQNTNGLWVKVNFN